MKRPAGMHETPTFIQQNEGKQDFGSIYDSPDPYGYYQTLGRFDYVIPAEAKPVLERVIAELQGFNNEDRLRIVDVGCSYGVNSALLKCDLQMDDLYRYYASRGPQPNGAAVGPDSRFFESQGRGRPLEVVGLDVAGKAVEYGREAGLLDEGITRDLEAGPLPTEEAGKVAQTDLVISTGCVGYVTEKTFERLLSAVESERAPWIASFVLRMFPYTKIEESLLKLGLVTEKLEDRLFPQRSFATSEERDHCVAALERTGRDASAELADDRYYAEFFLSRPAAQVGQVPLEEFWPSDT